MSRGLSKERTRLRPLIQKQNVSSVSSNSSLTYVRAPSLSKVLGMLSMSFPEEVSSAVVVCWGFFYWFSCSTFSPHLLPPHPLPLLLFLLFLLSPLSFPPSLFSPVYLSSFKCLCHTSCIFWVHLVYTLLISPHFHLFPL